MTTERIDVLARFAANHSPVPEAGCWIWHGDYGRKGYGRMRVVGGRTVRAHRLSYEIHVGPIAEGMCVCHKCDTPACVNPAHLFLETNAGNTADRVRKGRSAGGKDGPHTPVRQESHHQAKLTRQQVAEIRALAVSGECTQREIASAFGISQSNVSTIKNGGSWYPERRSRRSVSKDGAP